MFKSAGVPDDPVPFIGTVPVMLGIAVLLITCAMTTIGGMILYSKRKRATTRKTQKEVSTSELSPLSSNDLPLQTVNER